MRKRLFVAAITVCLLLMVWTGLPHTVQASSENGSRSELSAQVNKLNSLIATTSRVPLKQFLESVRDQANAVLGTSEISYAQGLTTDKALKYALKLVKDTNPSGSAELWANSPFIVYSVKALSPEMRLPDNLPEDGKVSDQLKIVSAQGEFEAASFVLAPLSDVSSVTFTINDLQGSSGSTIPASAIDMHVVKTWYQGGTAWQSYFFDDTKDVLVPELLLHDENLIKLDDGQKKNFLRVDYPTGSQYVNISGSPPQFFNRWTQPVEDSPVLLPITLKQGQSKQMWVTTKVPGGTPEGVYTGTIDITANGAPAGQLMLKIHVLPFELPDPKTNYDLNKDFYVMMMHGSTLKNELKGNEGNTQLAEQTLLNHYRNLVEHNVVNLPPHSPFDVNHPQNFLRQVELMKQAGVHLNPFFGAGPAFTSNEYYSIWNSYLIAKKAYEANPTDANRTAMESKYNAYLATLEPAKDYIRQTFDAVSAAVGHTNIYFDGWDEAEWNRLLWQQPLWDYIKEDVGAKVFATGNATHLELPTTEEFIDWAGEPTLEKADAWHALGSDKLITNYAHPHSGPENPDLMRQRHGMWLYKANYDATYNYIWYFDSDIVSAWSEYIDATFRGFNFVYPTRTDVIDTLAWEGFREGIDDIRYATKLKLVAQDALASGNVTRIAAATKALTWLEKTDERSTNSDLIRYEMIQHIMKMLNLAHAE
ncbi:hypothetical protein ACFQZR_04215 [Paenibacillus sp. GCM10027629]|uniref:hypothetical protein n=1 Tax=Paenibacillus sp. GCM10027629 TaxID=3273414 RepID=UPI0036352016